MPPQSRGEAPRSRSFANTVPPILDSFLENLPSPTSVFSDQRTPTGPPPQVLREAEVSTPTRLNHFGIPADGEEDEEVTLDDEEFQSHYSRQSSPASESSEDAESEEAEDGLVQRPNSPDLQRTISLPASAPSNGHLSRLHTSTSTHSLPPPLPPPLPLYPPFYNRPPTPLPPSPSLTSLLRPPSILSRSTQSTRPTTPDSSDVETPNDTEAAVFHSARKAQPLPPSHPKVPTYEYYGFVLYLASSLAFALYILWSVLPSPFLHGLGIRYYPDRWWALAIPAWIVMLLCFIYVALLSYNVEYLTLPLGSVECLVDDAANVAVVDERGARVRRGGSKRLESEWAREKDRRRTEVRNRSVGAAGGTAGGGGGSWDRSSGAGGKSKRERDKQQQRRQNSGGLVPATDMYGVSDSVFGSLQNDTEPYTAHPLASGMSWRQIWNEGTDAVMDVPIGGVCEVLYGENRVEV